MGILLIWGMLVAWVVRSTNQNTERKAKALAWEEMWGGEGQMSGGGVCMVSTTVGIPTNVKY